MRFTDICRPLMACALGLVVLTGCRDERAPELPPGPEAAGREYFPIAVGRFWEYDVEEHIWNYDRDSVAYFQLQERVDTVYRGATGELTYHLIRSRRADSLANWRDDSTTAIVLTADIVRRQTDNLPTIELLFPVREGKSWNPNLFNALDSSVRAYSQLGLARTLPGGRRFARTVRVVDEPQISQVKRAEQEATYAWNIGRVYRFRRSLSYCNVIQVQEGRCQLGDGYIVRGFSRQEQLRKWGTR